MSDLEAIHPLGKSPMITDNDKTIVESGAVIEYIVDTYGGGRLKPAPGSSDHLQYTYWMHAAEGSLMPLVSLQWQLANIEARAPFYAKSIAKRITAPVRTTYLDPTIAKFMAFMEQTISSSKWFVGEEFTAADIQMAYPVEVLESGTGLDGFPKLRAFVEAVRARPAYQTALKNGGPFFIETPGSASLRART
jgi:glutathione S-transferase